MRRAERINGYSCRLITTKPFAVAAYDQAGREVARGSGKNEKEACRQLIEAVYRIHCKIVDQRQGYKCAECERIAPLEHDHITARGMGGANRDDRISNLRALCTRCHKERHGEGKH